MAEATNQVLLTQVLQYTCEDSPAVSCQTHKLTICALTQRSQDTRGTFHVSALLCPPFAPHRNHHWTPLAAAIRRHSSPFAAIRRRLSSRDSTPPFVATIQRQPTPFEATTIRRRSCALVFRQRLGLPPCVSSTVTRRSIISCVRKLPPLPTILSNL